ncbi:uncharacterized protein BJ171DRAFT_635262 [Polychytrium aggregatum]|uniref:uncharacterized protein n=1 Tax=Polychytrium aggregatum TaxID=110093 RepID=UPI0022FF2A19|nr:uncharacterized protein BJ171DRAFT_635262 [Polychytrium aggregatum]KAI9193670.1 hypothetical protein BJ171DRAFT_635262 [Polychytrium aggregatum]
MFPHAFALALASCGSILQCAGLAPRSVNQGRAAHSRSLSPLDPTCPARPARPAPNQTQPSRPGHPNKLHRYLCRIISHPAGVMLSESTHQQLVSVILTHLSTQPPQTLDSHGKEITLNELIDAILRDNPQFADVCRKTLRVLVKNLRKQERKKAELHHQQTLDEAARQRQEHIEAQKRAKERHLEEKRKVWAEQERREKQAELAARVQRTLERRAQAELAQKLFESKHRVNYAELPPLYPGPPGWIRDVTEIPEGLRGIPDDGIALQIKNYIRHRELDRRFAYLMDQYDGLGGTDASLSYSQHEQLFKKVGFTLKPVSDKLKSGFQMNLDYLLNHVSYDVAKDAPHQLRSCEECGEPTKNECRCGEAFCSKRCQQTGWRTHRFVCTAISASNEHVDRITAEWWKAQGWSEELPAESETAPAPSNLQFGRLFDDVLAQLPASDPEDGENDSGEDEDENEDEAEEEESPSSD